MYMKRGTPKSSSENCYETKLLLVKICCRKEFQVFDAMIPHSIEAYFCACTLCARYMWLHVRRRPLQLIYYADCNGVDCTAAFTKTHTKAHTGIPNIRVITTKNEQNSSLIHMTKYNPFDGNCIRFVLTYFSYTCMYIFAAWIAFHVCFFLILRLRLRWYVHKYVLNLLSGWQRRWLCNHQSEQLHLMFGFYISTTITTWIR